MSETYSMYVTCERDCAYATSSALPRKILACGHAGPAHRPSSQVSMRLSSVGPLFLHIFSSLTKRVSLGPRATPGW